MANQVQNKPTAAYILSLLGGIIGLLASLFVMFVWGILAWLTASAYDYGYYGYEFSGFFIGYTVFGIWMLVTSILIIRYARKLNADPMQAGKYGKYIIVLSILGVGGLLGLIGGILAVTYKPIPAGAPQQYYAPPPQQAYQAPPPQQAHPCPQCGTMVQPGVRFCPNCGRQQY